MNKIKGLLPPVQLLPSEWALVVAILEGMGNEIKGIKILFQEGVCYTWLSSSDYEQWGNEEPIRHMEVDQSMVRAYLNEYMAAEFDPEIEYAADCIFQIFCDASYCPLPEEPDYSCFDLPRSYLLTPNR